MAAKTLFIALLALTCFVALASGHRGGSAQKSPDNYKPDSEDVSLKPTKAIETDDRGNAAISNDHRGGAVPNQSHHTHSSHQNFHQAADSNTNQKEGTSAIILFISSLITG